MKSLSQYRHIEYQLKGIELKKGLCEEDKELKNELEITLSSLNKKHKVLNEMNKLFNNFKFKPVIEKIYYTEYISIYFLNNTIKEIKEIDRLCVLFKSIPKYIYYTEVIDDETFKHKSPTIFFGGYKDFNTLKLSIPVFIYNNDVDFMNFLDNKLQSFTRTL